MNNPKILDVIDTDSLLTSYQVGSLLQVNPSSVNKWVKDGRITAFRTPGGHRRIRAGDLVHFLAEHKMPIPVSLQQAAHKRLLIVDDDKQHVEHLQRHLKAFAEQLDILIATNGMDALMQIGSFKPNVVLLAWNLSGMDGLEICKRLKAGADTQHIEVMMMHHENNPTHDKKAQEHGAKRYLVKPIDIQALTALLNIQPKA